MHLTTYLTLFLWSHLSRTYAGMGIVRSISTKSWSLFDTTSALRQGSSPSRSSFIALNFMSPCSLWRRSRSMHLSRCPQRQSRMTVDVTVSSHSSLDTIRLKCSRRVCIGILLSQYACYPLLSYLTTDYQRWTQVLAKP